VKKIEKWQSPQVRTGKGISFLQLYALTTF